MSPMKWYGPQCVTKVLDSCDQRLEAAGRALRDHAKREVSRAQPTAGTGEKKRGLDPSKPGEYPKKVTGDLRMGIAMEYDKGSRTARVGTNVKHGKYLELGTHKMQRRPWLSRALSEMWAKLRSIIGRGARHGGIGSGT